MIAKELLDRINHDIIEYGIDYRAEVLAHNLAKNGLAFEQIIFQLKGIAKRSFRKDVSDYYLEISNYDGNEYLHLLILLKN